VHCPTPPWAAARPGRDKETPDEREAREENKNTGDGPRDVHHRFSPFREEDLLFTSSIPYEAIPMERERL
jgi:hypothetical protein